MGIVTTVLVFGSDEEVYGVDIPGVGALRFGEPGEDGRLEKLSVRADKLGDLIEALSEGKTPADRHEALLRFVKEND